MSLEPLTLVWAPIKGYPMWPSQIVDPAVCNNDKVLRAGKEGHLLVYYFGDHMFGWYARETHGLKDYAEHYETYSAPKAGKTKLFQTALDEAEAEKNDLGATAKRWKQSLTEEQIRSRKQASAAAEASKSAPAAKKEAKPKQAATPKEAKSSVKSCAEAERTGFDVFRSNIGDSLDTNELHVYQEMWDAMTADRKQYYEDLARAGEKKDAVKKGGKVSASAAPPRKPPAAFQLYVAANKNIIRDLGLTQKEFKIYMQGEWESAAPAVRAPFEREAMEKMSVYQSKRTEWIMAHPEAGAALSDKEDEVAADAFSVGEAEPLPDDDPRNHDYCEQCGRGGELICCDGCPASYHPKCLPVPRSLAELPDHWFCHVCTASRGLTVDQKISPPDTKKKSSSALAVSPMQQRPELKRERSQDDGTVPKKIKSERDASASSGDNIRGPDGNSGVPRQSSEHSTRRGDEAGSGWPSRAPDNASTRERDARAPDSSTPRLSEAPRHPPNSRLFISGVNCGMTERDLALEIKKFGKIAEQFRFRPGAAFVHVQMATAEDAVRAMTGLKNFRFLGREAPLNVKIADPRPGLSSSDRAKEEVPHAAASGQSVSYASEKLVPGMTRSEIENVLRKLGFDRNAACLEDVRRLRDEMNDLTRTFDQKSTELTNMRSVAHAKMEEEKNHRLRSLHSRRDEDDVRKYYQDLQRKLDIEVEENREKDRSAHRQAQTNWKRKRQNVLGAHQVPCFIDQGLPPRDMWTTIDHAWAYLDRCAPPSEPRREQPRSLVQEPPRNPPPAHTYPTPVPERRPHEVFAAAPPPLHYEQPATAGWQMPPPHHAPPPGYVAPPPMPPPHNMSYPPNASHYPPPYAHPPPPKFGMPPPPQPAHHAPMTYAPPPKPHAAPAFGSIDFGSADIVAALSQLEALTSQQPSSSGHQAGASNMDVDHNELFTMLLKD